jgi:hypothetical protein
VFVTAEQNSKRARFDLCYSSFFFFFVFVFLFFGVCVCVLCVFGLFLYVWCVLLTRRCGVLPQYRQENQAAPHNPRLPAASQNPARGSSQTPAHGSCQSMSSAFERNLRSDIGNLCPAVS